MSGNQSWVSYLGLTQWFVWMLVGVFGLVVSRSNVRIRFLASIAVSMGLSATVFGIAAKRGWTGDGMIVVVVLCAVGFIVVPIFLFWLLRFHPNRLP